MFYSPHPLLRKRETETATVSYSELLFDLIYVFWSRNFHIICFIISLGKDY